MHFDPCWCRYDVCRAWCVYWDLVFSRLFGSAANGSILIPSFSSRQQLERLPRQRAEPGPKSSTVTQQQATTILDFSSATSSTSTGSNNSNSQFLLARWVSPYWFSPSSLSQRQCIVKALQVLLVLYRNHWEIVTILIIGKKYSISPSFWHFPVTTATSEITTTDQLSSLDTAQYCTVYS